MFRKMKLGLKLIGGFLIVALVAGAIAVFGVINLRNLDAADTYLYEKATVPLGLLVDIGVPIQRARVNVHKMYITTDLAEIDTLAKKVTEYETLVDQNLLAYKATLIDKADEDAYNLFLTEYEAFKLSTAEQVALLKEGRIAEATEILNGTGMENSNALNSQLDVIVTVNVKAAKTTSDGNTLAASTATTTMIAISGVGILLAVLLGLVLSNSITKPMKKLMDMVTKISEGDFSNAEEVKTKAEDEIGVLARASNAMLNGLKGVVAIFQKMAAGDMSSDFKVASDKDELGSALVQMLTSLNETLSQVNDAVEQVAAGSGQVSQASQSLSQGATEQASSLEEITSSITQVSGQTKLNTENAVQMNSLAKTSKEDAERGNVQMKDLVAAMTDIKTSSEEIKKIVKAIDDISFQINLLALNANVEAARAGKYGKGFAVVAEEVRNLAVRSANSVKDTTRMVDEAISNIERGNKLVGVTAQQLASIVDGSTKVAGLSEEVAVASKEQTQGLEQITVGLTQVDQVTQANTASSEESAAAAEELSSQAQQLRAMLARFKLRAKELNMSNQDAVLQMLRAELARQQYSGAPAASPASMRPAMITAARKAEPIEHKRSLATTIVPADVISLDDANFGKF